jgi:hypothetical protein
MPATAPGIGNGAHGEAQERLRHGEEEVDGRGAPDPWTRHEAVRTHALGRPRCRSELFAALIAPPPVQRVGCTGRAQDLQAHIGS